jgi:hypothetical protein
LTVGSNRSLSPREHVSDKGALSADAPCGFGWVDAEFLEARSDQNLQLGQRLSVSNFAGSHSIVPLARFVAWKIFDL